MGTVTKWMISLQQGEDRNQRAKSKPSDCEAVTHGPEKPLVDVLSSKWTGQSGRMMER